VADGLDVATVVTASAEALCSAHEALCALMSPDPLLPTTPVVGSDNWYSAYGKGFGPEAVLRDARTIVQYADGHPVSPYCVIDDGWTQGGGSAPGGPWGTGLPRVFDDMREIASRVKDTGARPGLWFRPSLSRVETAATRPAVWRDSGHPLDPSLGVALDAVAADVRRFRSWGYELTKHDFATYDLFGRSAVGSPPELAEAGWAFADRSRTNAEILVRLYTTIAEAAGDAVVIGCKHGRSSGGWPGAGAGAANRRRHVGTSPGENPQDGCEHARVPAGGAQPLLRARHGLRAVPTRGRLGDEPAVPRLGGPFRHSPVRLRGPGRTPVPQRP
jgi:hypothetical protein